MSERVEVTSENFGDLLIEGLKEAVAYERGELQARTSRRKITARRAAVPEPPEFDGARIGRIRECFSVSQPVFAQLLGVKVDTVKAWEGDKKAPGGAARRLLELAERRPEVLTASLKTSLKPAPERKRSAATK